MSTNTKNLGNANDFFNELSESTKVELELEKLLIDIACKFINYRAQHNLTQKDLAKKLQITQAMISKLESGDYNPTVKMLYDISHKLSWDFSVNINAIEPSYTFNCNEKANTKTENQSKYNERMGLAS